MLSEETIDLYDSLHEDGALFTKSSPLSFSDFERNIQSKVPEKVINTSMTSSNNSSDDEESISLQASNHSHSPTCSQNLSNLSVEVLKSPDKLYTSNLKPFGAYSYEHIEGKTVTTEEKIAELKTLKSKVNDAYVNYKINEFVLDTIKTKSTSWAKQIKTICKNSEIQDKIGLVCENGEVTNLLGLEEEDLKPITSRSLLLINKSAFHDNNVKLVEANLAKLKQQKKLLQDEFGAHSMKTVVGVLTRERREQLELSRHVEDLQNQVRQLINGSTSIVQQLATLRHDSSQHLKTATYELLRHQALYINTVISTLNEQLNQSLFVDESMKKKMDTEGDNLKTQVTQLREELKALQKTLKEYEKKEAESAKYKELVAEYGRLRKQLELKRETLKMLDDPDVSL